MGDKQFMKSQIRTKLNEGFDCLKMKIGAIDFETELALVQSIRKNLMPKPLRFVLMQMVLFLSLKLWKSSSVCQIMNYIRLSNL